MTSLTQITVADFLILPNIDESPAWEYIEGISIQKPMPKTRYSMLQKRLLTEIDNHSQKFTALPELRCTFGGRSIVPDVAVVAWDRIKANAIGEPEDNFTSAPDWSIGILSPEQNPNRVIDNLLHCLNYGCQLGWMIDPDDYSVLILLSQQAPQVCRASSRLLIPEDINLDLTAEQVFKWLKIDDRYSN